MKLKKFLIFVLFTITAVFLAGCSFDIFNDDDDPTKPEDPQPVVDIVTSKIDFTFAEYKTTFFINDSSGYVQTIYVKFYDSEGNEINTGKVTWEDNLPSGTEKHSTVNSYTFNAKTVNTLGDYTITAKVVGNEKISKSYTFSQRSHNTLDTSLTYSYVSAIEFEYDDNNNIIGVANAIELNEAGIKIEYPAARMELNNTIKYKANGNSWLLISAKEGTDFGILTPTITSGSDIKFLSVGKNKFLLWSQNSVEGSYQLSIKAGNKDVRTVTIKVEKPTSETLPDPVLDVSLAYAEEDGKIVSITGDNVNTGLYDTEDCNYLRFDVQIKDDSGQYVEYNFFENILSYEVKYGYQVHLAHCGEYKIMAYLFDCIGNYSYAEKTVTVEPYTYPTIEVNSVKQEEKIYNSTSHKELWKNTNTIDPAVMATVKIKSNSLSEEKEKYRLTVLYEDDDIRSDETNFTDLEFSTETTLDLKYAGTNKLRIERISTPGYGYPVIYKENTNSTMFENYFEKEIIIAGDSYYEDKELVNLSVDNNSNIVIKAGYDLNDYEHIYVALFRINENNKEEYVADRDDSGNGYILSKSKNQISCKYDPSYIYFCKYYVFADYDQIPSSIQKKYVPLYLSEYVPRLSVVKTPDKNESTIIIRNYQNYGRFIACYYLITDSLTLPANNENWNTISSWKEVSGTSVPTYEFEKTVTYSDPKYVWLRYSWNRNNDGKDAIEYEYAVCRLDADSTSIDVSPVVTVEKLRNDKERVRKTRFLIENKNNLELYYSLVNSNESSPAQWTYLGNKKDFVQEIDYDKDIYDKFGKIEDRYLWIKAVSSDTDSKKESIIGSIDVCLKRVYPMSAIFTTINDSDEIQTLYGLRQFRLDNIKTYHGKSRKIYYSFDDFATSKEYDSNNPIVTCPEGNYYKIGVRVEADEDDYVVKTKSSHMLNKQQYMPHAKSPYLHFKFHTKQERYYCFYYDADVTFTCDDAKIEYKSTGFKENLNGFSVSKEKGKNIVLLDNVYLESVYHIINNTRLGIEARQIKKGYCWSYWVTIYHKDASEEGDIYKGDV